MPAILPHFGVESNTPYSRGMSKSLYTPEQKQLTALLRQVRQEAGLTQAGLASRLGRPQTFVSKYELGERRLDLLQLRQICRAVGLTLEEFVRRLEVMLRDRAIDKPC